MQFLMRFRKDLRIYQNRLYEMMRRMDLPGLMVLLKPGLGKTATTLTVLRDMLDAQEISKVLIIAPLLVAEETWPEEIAIWSHTQVLQYEIITGSEERRLSRLQQSAEIHITNKENVVWLTEHFGDDWPYDCLVVDESSTLKNPARTTKPSKKKILAHLADPENVKKPVENQSRFGALCGIRHHLMKVFLLTGTPAPKGLLDLWSQYYLIDGGERLGPTFNSYQKRYFVSDHKGYSYTPRDCTFDVVMKKVRDITFSMLEEDWIELPERIFIPVLVKLPEKLKKQYNKFKRTLLLEEHDIEAVNSGVLTGKLLQYANGSVYDENHDAQFIHDLKYRKLDAIIEEANGESILLAYSYQFDLEELRRRYPHMEVLGEKEGQVKRWNAGEIELLAAHPAAAGYGLNLQYGGHICIWFGLPWSLEWFIQLNKRLHRSGQIHKTSIYMIMAEGTDDERVLEVLTDREATQEAIFNATLFDFGFEIEKRGDLITTFKEKNKELYNEVKATLDAEFFDII